jgi:hypothetical protein
MKTHVIQDEPDPGRGAAMAATGAGAATATPGARRRRGAGVGSALAMGLGGLGLLVALVLLVGGGAVLIAMGDRDRDGYFMSGAHRIDTPSAALVTGGLDIDADVPEWALGERAASTRVQASSVRPTFVGVGPSADVERYLARVGHAQVTDVDTDPFRVTSRLVPGSARPAPPADQDFWRVRSSGTGTRTVTWPLESGRWSVVMMNADGSRGVDVQARFGARVPAVRWIAYGLLAGGLVALLAGGLLLRLGLPRTSPQRRS